jgi:hypothetical protein
MRMGIEKVGVISRMGSQPYTQRSVMDTLPVNQDNGNKPLYYIQIPLKRDFFLSKKLAASSLANRTGRRTLVRAPDWGQLIE